MNGTIYVGVSSDQKSLAAKIAKFVPAFRGSVAALDINIGNVLWQTYVIPRATRAVQCGRATLRSMVTAAGIEWGCAWLFF